MLSRRDMEPIDETETSAYLDQLHSPSLNDSLHFPYTESAILIDSVTTPSYCRSDASARSFLYPLSADYLTEETNVHLHLRTDDETSNNSTLFTDSGAATVNTAPPSTMPDATEFSNISDLSSLPPWSNGTSILVEINTGDVESFDFHDVQSEVPFTDGDADGYEDTTSFALLPPPSEITSEEKPPAFYYDDDQYEDHVNIWASRVWTSSSGKEEDLESFLQAMELARFQLAQHQVHSNSLSQLSQPSAISTILEAIDEDGAPTMPPTLPLVVVPPETVPRYVVYHVPSAPPPPLSATTDMDGIPVSSSDVLSSPSSRRRSGDTRRGSSPPRRPSSSSTQDPPLLSPILMAKLHSSGLQWYDRVFLMPHEPLRQALRHIRRLVSLKYMPFAQSWKLRSFFRWFDHLTLFVRTQFRIKATVLLPTILGVAPRLRESLDATVRSYDAVLQVLGAVSFFRTPPETDMAYASYILQLAEYLATLEHILTANLDRDELDFGSALASTFNHESYVRLAQKKMEVAMPSEAKRVMVPWMTHACDALDAIGLMDDWQWGWWSKWLYEHQWRAYFDTHVAARLREIEFADTPCPP
ncbi:Aste57867_24341 [Aphanomyces stellatus]|uniref:Aste57867_24341 protein n=1 Tax=Aphanomyces stellatus TaxID=120398 RepID=A0A485LQW8_9STRA|nr:hypothetical protein As57867_024266 [Aphanomyces stellatus]VFU00981.1 Aste57867_24341 [Aphanomyces stellatus]